MLQELIGKTVKVYLGPLVDFSDNVKGEVVEVNDSWLKVKTKRSVELIGLKKISRISS